jgi:hypothetical protein
VAVVLVITSAAAMRKEKRAMDRSYYHPPA